MKIRQRLTGQIRMDFLRRGTYQRIWIRRRLFPPAFSPFRTQGELSKLGKKQRNQQMNKIGRFVVTLFFVFVFAPWQMLAVSPPPPFFPTLISPTAGQVLYPGQKVRVEWKTSIPNQIPYPTWCDIELWLSLDGGRTYTIRITPSMDPNTRFVYRIVPNTPTNSALLDICFGCEPSYPETYHTQTGSPFVIPNTGSQSC